MTDNNEDYLDNLLKAASVEIDPNSALGKVAAITEIAKAETRAQEAAKAEAEAESNKLADIPTDPNAKLDADQIAALFAAANSPAPEPEPAVEEVAEPIEEVIEPEPVAEPIEEVIEPEPVVEETPSVDIPSDPNAKLDADQIAALFAAANGPAPEPEPAVEEVAEPIEEVIEPEPVAEPIEEVIEPEPVAEPIEEVIEPEPVVEEVEEPAVEEAAEPPAEGGVDGDAVTEYGDLDALENVDAESIEALLAGAEAAANEAPGSDESSLADADDSLADINLSDIANIDELNDDSKEDNTVSSASAGEMMDLINNDLGIVSPKDEEISVADELSELSVEDIVSKLDEASDVKNIEELEIDMNDLDAMAELGIREKDDSLPETDELDEINSLLSKLDNDEEIEPDASADDLEELNSDDDGDSKDKKSKKKEKVKKDKTAKKDKSAKKDKKSKKGTKKPSQSDEIELVDADMLDSLLAADNKKKNLFERIIDFLTASDEDEDVTSTRHGEDNSEGFEDIQGENKEILQQLDAEGEDESGKGKKKKKDKKKGKADTKEASDSEGMDDDEEAASGKGKGKKKKKDKAPREKKPFFEKDPNEKPLNKRNVRIVVVFAMTVLVALVLVIMLIPKSIGFKAARKAFYHNDYETVYNTFFGEKLEESDRLMFERSKVMLKVSHKYEAYQSFMKLNKPTEALDQLLQAVDRHEDCLRVAEACDYSDEYMENYNKILTVLNAQFGLTEEKCREILSLPTDLEYSLMVESIATGCEYIDPNEPLPGPFVPPVEEVEPVYEDMIPEEQ